MRPSLRLLLALPLCLLAACEGGSAPTGAAAPAAPRAVAGEGRGLVITNPTSSRDYFTDLGTIPYGEQRRHTFELLNTDPKPVTIHDLLPSCSCSMPDISYVDVDGHEVVGDRRAKPVLVVPPGATVHVVIEVDTTHVKFKNVDKLSQVRLRCDSENTAFITFELHMIVELAFQATPAEIVLKQVPVSGGGHEATDVITAIPNAGVEILGVASQSEGLEVTLDDFTQFGERVWRVGVTLEPPLELGTWTGEVVLRTSGLDGTGEGRPFVVPVRAEIVPDVVVQPSPLGFTPFSPATGATAAGNVVALAPGHRVKVLGASFEGEVPEGLEVAYEPVQPDGEGRAERWKLTLSAPPSFPRQRLLGKVVLELDDPANPRLVAPFVFLGS